MEQSAYGTRQLLRCGLSVSRLPLYRRLLPSHVLPKCKETEQGMLHAGRLHRHSHRGSNGRPQANLRVHDLQLCNASHRPDHQLGSKDPVHVSWHHSCAHRLSGPQWCSRRRGRSALAVLCCVVQPCTWFEGMFFTCPICDARHSWVS